MITEENKQGIVNAQGDTVVESKYDTITYAPYKDENNKSVFECKINNKITYYDQNGDIFKPHKRKIKRKTVIVASILLTITILLFFIFSRRNTTKPDSEVFLSGSIMNFIEGDIIQVSTGKDFSAALTSDGSVWMWGDNLYENHTATINEFNGDTSINIIYSEESNKPRKRKALIDDVAYIATGGILTAGIKNDGSLWTWGNNSDGALGNGKDYKNTGDSFTIDLTPHKILDDVETVSLGKNWGLALKKDGSLWTWGTNLSGNIGNGTLVYSTVPIKILEDVTSAYAGTSHAVALKRDGTLWAWGETSKVS